MLWLAQELFVEVAMVLALEEGIAAFSVSINWNGKE